MVADCFFAREDIGGKESEMRKAQVSAMKPDEEKLFEFTM